MPTHPPVFLPTTANRAHSRLMTAMTATLAPAASAGVTAISGLLAAGDEGDDLKEMLDNDDARSVTIPKKCSTAVTREA